MMCLAAAVFGALLGALCMTRLPEKPLDQVQAEEYGRQVKGGG